MLFHIWDFEAVSKREGAPISNLPTSWEGSTSHIAGTGKPLLFHISHLCVEFGFPIAAESIFPITGLYYGSSCVRASNWFLGFLRFWILANLTDVIFLLFFKFWPVWDIDREREIELQEGLCVTFVKAQILTRNQLSLEVMLNWAQQCWTGLNNVELGETTVLEEMNWEYISAAASCMPRF